MKNKGFTLIELLAVLVLLVVIFILIVPGVTNILVNSKKNINQTQINTILKSAYDWSLENSINLPGKDNSIYVTLGILKYNGFIESNLINPETEEPFPDNLVVKITNVGANHKYSNKNSKLEGNYLFTLEIEKLLEEEYNIKKPTIKLNDLVSDSQGNYVTNVSINSTFTNVSYSAESKDKVDLTDKVITYIVYDNNIVSSVDTSKIGIYYIIYTVVDDDGYSTIVTRSIIVSDFTAPTLIIPEQTVIDKSVITYDLFDDVECNDNSSKCDITINGAIDYGNSGKYIIEYVAKDPSGNTTIKKRVIEIE